MNKKEVWVVVRALIGIYECQKTYYLSFKVEVDMKEVIDKNWKLIIKLASKQLDNTTNGNTLLGSVASERLLPFRSVDNVRGWHVYKHDRELVSERGSTHGSDIFFEVYM